MATNRIKIFDTTLRDGEQAQADAYAGYEVGHDIAPARGHGRSICVFTEADNPTR